MIVEHLSETLDSFPGMTNQTRCFVHTLSISAKAILKQFDVPKEQNDKVLDVAAQAFADLAKELEVEEKLALESQEVEDNKEDDQPLDSWVDLQDGLTEEQLEELDASIQPVQLMLIKVCFVYHLVCLFDP
jgi:hypothetical protein